MSYLDFCHDVQEIVHEVTRESYWEYLQSKHFALINYTKNTNNKSLKDLWIKRTVDFILRNVISLVYVY